jgi:hypothetical protein
MTEAEWMACTDPAPMLHFLQGKVSERKFRLIALGCCRQLWEPADRLTSAALAIVDQLAEAGALQTTMGSVRVPAGEAVLNCGASEPLESLSAKDEGGGPEQVPRSALPPLLASILADLACLRTNPALLARLLVFLTKAGLPPVRQTALIRDIVRGPLHPILFRASWRTWSGGVCLEIARRIYKERAFDHLPILADALEEAGCTDADILGHCRAGGEHVRGCWVVDLVLGKS